MLRKIMLLACAVAALAALTAPAAQAAVWGGEVEVEGEMQSIGAQRVPIDLSGELMLTGTEIPFYIGPCTHSMTMDVWNEEVEGEVIALGEIVYHAVGSCSMELEGEVCTLSMQVEEEPVPVNAGVAQTINFGPGFNWRNTVLAPKSTCGIPSRWTQGQMLWASWDAKSQSINFVNSPGLNWGGDPVRIDGQLKVTTNVVGGLTLK